MKPEERDDLLGRLSERTNNIWYVVEKLEKHQETQNNFIADLIKDTAKNSGWRTTSKWIIGISLMIALAALSIALGV